MICGIHQPNYLPWIGYIHKVSLCDVFIFYDTTQYTKGDFRNRNSIKGANGKVQLTLPVKFHLGDTINKVTFDSRVLKKHSQTISQSYSKALFFKENKDFLERIYSYKGDNLSEYSIFMIQEICKHLDIQTKFVTLSNTSFVLNTTSTEALVDICKYVEADTYIVGGDAGYMQNDLFSQNDIVLRQQNFTHPEYQQLWGEFLPYLSVIDLILNEGISSAKSIISSFSS